MEAAGPDGSFAGLLKRARAGDLNAFDDVIRMHEKRVFRIAYRLLGNTHDAQDATQDVFLKLYRSLHQFDGVREFNPWLNRITINACHDIARKRRTSVSIENAFQLSSAADPEGDVGAQERVQLLQRALLELPEQQRAAIVMRDIEGLSSAEVASAIGTGEATVRSHIASARIKLRRIIEEWTRRKS